MTRPTPERLAEIGRCLGLLGAAVERDRRTNYEWRGEAQRWEAERALAAICAEIDALASEIATHRCQLPSSIIEALNSGDGTYRP